MKRYLIFVIHRPDRTQRFAAFGGWNDLKLVTDDKTEALIFIGNSLKEPDVDYCQLVDTQGEPEVRYLTSRGERIRKEARRMLG